MCRIEAEKFGHGVRQICQNLNTGCKHETKKPNGSPMSCDCRHSTTTADNSSMVIAITIDHGLAEVKPAYAPALTSLLQYEELRFHVNRGRLRHDRQVIRAYDLRPDDCLHVAPGCVRRVQQQLQRLGHLVEIRDLRGLEDDLYRIDTEHVAEAEAAFPGLTAAIQNNVPVSYTHLTLPTILLV